MKSAPFHRLQLALGLLELAAVVALLLVGWSFPTRRDVERTFGSAREMAQVSQQHIQSLEGQITNLRNGADALHKVMAQATNILEELKYPVITLNGITPTVKWQNFIPSGPTQLAKEISKATKAGVNEVDSLQHDLPRIRNSLKEMDSDLLQYSQRSAAALWYTRLLMWIVAAIVGLHGGHLVLNSLVLILRPDAIEQAPLDSAYEVV